MSYEKLSKKALGCMYAATGIAMLVVITIVVALNLFWFLEADINALLL